ncbi:MAG: ATP-binding protein [Thermodesulfobacteriota bacterium]
MKTKTTATGALRRLEGAGQSAKKDIRYLEERIRYLEGIHRFTLDALEMAASLGNFQPSISKLEDIPAILAETGSRIKRLIQLKAMGIFMVDEETQDFLLREADPAEFKSALQNEVDSLIEDGTFAWAIKENRAVIVSSRDYGVQAVLHVLATNSRIRGMFVGLVEKERMNVHDVSLSLLSIILLNSANAIESLELYKLIRTINDNLRKKENYKNLFEAAPDGVEVLDARGHIVDCNKAYLKMLGYKSEEVVGQHTSHFFSDQSRPLFQANFPILVQEGYVESEVELIPGNGGLISIWRKEKAILDEAGAFVGAVVYNRDISRLKAVEEEKAILEAQLRRSQKMEALGTLAGGVAHDLNNVLGGLVSLPEFLLMQIPENSPIRSPLSIIKKSGEKAAAIVQDLLTLGRRAVAVNEVVNLNRIVEDYLMTPEFQRLASFHPNVQFETNLAENLLNVSGSPVHLSKTIMNLLSNAAEAMPKGGKVVVSTENGYLDTPIKGYDHVEEGDYVVLTVSDTGIGISREDLERIFEPFYTKKVMGRSGTGLGMAVVWGTVKDHNGYIDVQSVEGKGTTFTLYFKGTTERLAKVEMPKPMDEYRGHGQAILIVDDIEEQRHMAAQILKTLGYSVDTAASGEEAVRYVENRPVDLLILDMIMEPGIDGLETYKRILERHPGQKAIIVSGFSETDRIRKAERLGVGQFVRKPYTLEGIGKAVRDELSNRKPASISGPAS